MKKIRDKWRNKIILISLLFLLLFPEAYIRFFAISKIEDTLNTPPNTVGIVFGAATGKHGPSDIFSDRLITAMNLYEKKQIQKILISGDNSQQEYNEPLSGKKFLVSKGIPSEDIVLDYAGFRTYDTCIRAKKIFLLDSALLITQKFHLPRAIFLCEAFGIEVTGVPADQRTYQKWKYYLIREFAARWMSFWEGFIFRHDPKFLGNSLPIHASIEIFE